MKRIVKCGGMVLSLAIVLGAFCANGLVPGREKEAPVSISVSWGTTVNARSNAYKKINDFKKKYGNIEVKPDTWIIDSSTYYMKAATGRLPTIFNMALTEAERFKRNGFSVDLSESMEKYGYNKYLRKEIKEIVSENGTYYAIPQKAYLLGVVFNARLFEEAGLKNQDDTYQIPKTYDELAETARIITERTGKPGLMLETDKRIGGWLFTNIAWAYGTEFVKFEDGKWRAAFDSPECVEAFKYIWNLKWRDNVVPQNPHRDQQQARRMVLEGECAMIIDGCVNDIYSVWSGDKEALGFFSMPEGPKGKYELLGGSVFGISSTATPDQVEAAFKWLEYSEQTPMGANDANIEQSVENSYKALAEKDLPIGEKKYNVWTEDCPRVKAENEMRKKYQNVPGALYSDYNDMIDGKIPVIIKPEEPVLCQDLYYILTDCIREIYDNRNVDLEALAKDAAEQFQKEYLDKIN